MNSNQSENNIERITIHTKQNILPKYSQWRLKWHIVISADSTQWIINKRNGNDMFETGCLITSHTSITHIYNKANIIGYWRCFYERKNLRLTKIFEPTKEQYVRHSMKLARKYNFSRMMINIFVACERQCRPTAHVNSSRYLSSSVIFIYDWHAFIKYYIRYIEISCTQKYP